MAGTRIGDVGQRRIGRPAALGRSTRHEETDHHNHAAYSKGPKTRRIDLGKCHVGCADLQRHDEIAERRKGERHDAGENHDRAMHRA